MALDVLNWTRESRDDVNFALESKLSFASGVGAAAAAATAAHGHDPRAASSSSSSSYTVKMSPCLALLVTLNHPGQQQQLLQQHHGQRQRQGLLQFPRDVGVKQAALLLIREKHGRYSMVRVGDFD